MFDENLTEPIINGLAPTKISNFKKNQDSGGETERKRQRRARLSWGKRRTGVKGRNEKEYEKESVKGQVNSDCVDGGSDEKSKFNHKNISINPFQD